MDGQGLSNAVCVAVAVLVGVVVTVRGRCCGWGSGSGRDVRPDVFTTPFPPPVPHPRQRFPVPKPRNAEPGILFEIEFSPELNSGGKDMLLGDFLTQSALRFPHQTAVVNAGRRTDYQSLNRSACSLANGLISSGLVRQGRVAIYLENSTESVISIFGILKAGGVFLVINPQVKSKKLSYILRDCQVWALITDPTGAEQITSGNVICPDLKLMLVTDYQKSRAADASRLQDTGGVHTVSFENFLENSCGTEPPRACIDIDLASLIYTSGSTGDPKGVMLTHSNMVTAARSITQYLENHPGDIILNYLPLSFDYGLYQVLMSVLIGGTIILEKAFVFPYQAVGRIIDEKVTGLPVVPAMAALLLQLQDIGKCDFSSVRYITNTGQALPPSHIRDLQKAFKNASIYSMYGLTECKRVSYLPPSELSRRPLSVGKAIPNTETWLIDESGNKITRPWTVGELVIRGAHVMKGYWNKEEETSAVLKQGIYPGEKVLLSRDFFQMDEEGFLYFVSRKDDMIKSGAERISPKEIEDVLYEISGVSEVAVIGVPDPILGLALKAFVAVKQGSDLSVQQILDFCKQKLEHSRVPKMVEIRDSLPKSNSGKIRKKDLETESSSSAV